MKEENYLDSRTKEEREKDSKIESITTTSEQLKQKALKEFENLFGETRGLTGLGYQDFSLVERDGEKAKVFMLCHKDVKSFLFSKLNELEKAAREEIGKAIEQIIVEAGNEAHIACNDLLNYAEYLKNPKK